ncbi:MAG: 30S ribosomal protein S7, partial [Wolbachia endosymbiont of Pissodes strobi]|nr:30S ribosomal protein S7 [Wolbachia endosymbiont of Pissodes strobi]
VNIMMLNGKKTLSQNILYSALNIVFKKVNKYNIDIFENIIDKVRPLIEVKSRKIGGSTYQIPTEIKSERKDTLAIRWIIISARKRSKNESMFLKLSNEFIDILDNKGLSIKKRDEMHKMAESNKAFAHYRW